MTRITVDTPSGPYSAVSRAVVAELRRGARVMRSEACRRYCPPGAHADFWHDEPAVVLAVVLASERPA